MPPPAAPDARTAPTDGTVPGVLHVHTNRSDGLSAPDEIAAAAARAGLKFIVFTDHGDATRTPDPPAYRSGVLCLDGVEISTTGGHYIALDMPAAPYPLGGEARDVVEDVRRLGGFGIVAHPDSPKPELRWRDWAAPFDGIEMVNPDTSWRVWAQQPGWRARWSGCSRRWSTIRSGRAKRLPACCRRRAARSRAGGTRSRSGGASWRSPAPMRTRSSRCATPIPATAGSRCRLPATRPRSACCRCTCGRSGRCPATPAPMPAI